MQKITKEEILLISKIKRAVNSTIKNEIEILKNGRSEKNFTSHFAEQISRQIELENIDSDPFYDKHLGATKYLDGKKIELDIAVHERNTDSNNLIAIEIETNNNPERDDIWKIKSLTQKLGGYGYKIGLYIAFGIKKRAGQIIDIEWYKNGKLINVNNDA